MGGGSDMPQHDHRVTLTILEETCGVVILVSAAPDYFSGLGDWFCCACQTTSPLTWGHQQQTPFLLLSNQTNLFDVAEGAYPCTMGCWNGLNLEL